ncbi:hypothetical protein D3C77_396680 [compost metagenome]
MVTPVICIPAPIVENVLPVANDLFQLEQVPGNDVPFADSRGGGIDEHMLELERHIQFATAVSYIIQRLLWTESRRFSDGHDIVKV